MMWWIEEGRSISESHRKSHKHRKNKYLCRGSSLGIIRLRVKALRFSGAYKFFLYHLTYICNCVVSSYEDEKVKYQITFRKRKLGDAEGAIFECHEN